MALNVITLTTQRVVLVAAMVGTVACTSQTITLSRFVPSEVAMGSIGTLAITGLGGNAQEDGTHLLSRVIGDLSAFEVVRQPTFDDVAGPQNIDDMLLFGRRLSVDGVVGAYLDVGPITLNYRRAPSATGDGSMGCTWLQESATDVTGYIAISDMASGRTILFEPIDHHYSATEALFLDTLDSDATSCSDHQSSAWQDTPSLSDGDSLRLAALQDFAHHFAYKLVAHQEGEQVMLYSDRSLPQSEDAISALLMNDWSGAIAIYRAGIRGMNTWTTPKWAQARAHYNLGTTLSFGGEIDEGLTELHRAQALYPSSVFVEQIKRVKAYRAGVRATTSTRRLWQCHRGDENLPECASAKVF